MMDTTVVERTDPTRLDTIGRGTTIGVVAAVALNLVVLAIGNIGAPIEVVTGWAPDGAPLTVGEVVGTTIVSVAAGGLVLWIASRHWSNALRGWTIAAASVAVASALPLWRLDVDSGSKTALTAMHLLTGVVAIAGQHWAVLPRPGRGAHRQIRST